MNTSILETQRIILRPLTVEDAEDVFSWTGDERVARFMIYPRHESIDVTREWLASLAYEADNCFSWGFVLKESGKLFGSGSIKLVTEENAWMFGYNIAYDFWGKGLTTEAAKRMISFAYDECAARSFISDHAVDNPASGRVIEKCGLKFDRYGEYTKLDGSVTFKAKYYSMHME